MLNLQNLGALSRNDQWLFKNIHLDITINQRIALTGPSGCGKSSLLKSIVGLFPLKEGDIFWNQQKVTDWPQFRTQVLYVPQWPASNSKSCLKIWEELKSFQTHKNLQIESQFFNEGCEKLGLSDQLLKAPSSELSGGEKQSMTLLLALALKPQVLLLDEPTSAMDSQLTQRAEKLILDFISSQSASFAWISHDNQQVHRIASHWFRFEEQTLINCSNSLQS